MNKKALVKLGFGLLVAANMTACAPIISGTMNASVDEKAIHDKTAKYFGVASDNVVISGIQKGALSTSYQAKQAGKAFDCTIYYGEVKCVQTSSPTTTSAATGSQQTAPVDASMSALQAQTRLNQLGFSVGNPDGIFGKKSVEQLKLFQKSKGLTASGKLDSRTIEALR